MKEPIDKIKGFWIKLLSWKFLWFTFHSRHRLRIHPGYFIDKNGNKIVLEKEMIRSIYRPKPNTWYHIYVVYTHRNIIDIQFSRNLFGFNCFPLCRRVWSIFINKKRRIQPFKQYEDWFTFIKPPVQKLKKLTMPDGVQIITKGYIK